MQKISYFLELNDESVHSVAIDKPTVGVELIEHEFMFRLNLEAHSSFIISVYQRGWKKKNYSTQGNLIRIPLQRAHLDSHFEIVSKKEDGAILLSGCIQATENLPKPIFVVGSPRSGTSIVAEALRYGLGANIANETHIITAFSELESHFNKRFYKSEPSQHKGMSLSLFPNTYVKAELIKLIRNAYHATFTSGMIIDKTPGKLMLSMLPIAIYAFPDAEVIFCKRRAIENVVSRVEKFKGMTFKEHLTGWVKCFEEWKISKTAITSLLKRDCWNVEVDQYTILNKPEYAAKHVADGLNLSPSLVDAFAHVFSSKRPESKDATVKPVISLESVNWDEEQRSLFIKLCSKTMAEQGYSLDESYFI